MEAERGRGRDRLGQRDGFGQRPLKGRPSAATARRLRLALSDAEGLSKPPPDMRIVYFGEQTAISSGLSGVAS